MTRPVDALLEFLEAENARGVNHVYLDEGARDGLRALYESARASSKIGVASPARSAARIELPETIPQPEPAVVAPEISITATSKSGKLDDLRRQAENWPPIRALGTLREILVFSTGNPDARIMFVSEAPGYLEEKEREPFVGPAGQKLNDILKAMAISREEVYLSNIVKFRPATPKQTTNNRKPTTEEMAVCMPFVRKEIEIVRPEVIISLGITAAEGLLGCEGAITSMRGCWHDFEGTPVRVSYHPSYLLQSAANNPIKRQVWEDMLAVMEKIGMPISAKQRGYFSPKV